MGLGNTVLKDVAYYPQGILDYELALSSHIATRVYNVYSILAKPVY